VTTSPATAFSYSVAANVAYWRRLAGRVAPADLPRLDRERHNLFRAAEIGLALDETWREAAELVCQLFELVEKRGYWREWMPVLERALLRCGPADLRLKARILSQLGHFFQMDRRLDAALAAHMEEEQIGLRLADDNLLAHARLHLSEVYRHHGRYAEAERYGQAALRAFTALGKDNEKMAHAEGNLGLIAQLRGEMVNSELYLRQAITRWRQLDHRAHLARCLNNLANTLSAVQRNDAALAALAEAEEALDSTHNELDKVMVALTKGTILFNQGNLDAARAAFRRADSPYLRQSGHRYSEAIVANNLGNVCLAEKAFAEARCYLERSVELYRQMEARLMLANSIGGLAEALAGEGDWAAARPLYEEAAGLAAGFPEDPWAGRLLAKFRAALAAPPPAAAGIEENAPS
jgi:tetratricopeptide (TPR) repeat protein